MATTMSKVPKSASGKQAALEAANKAGYSTLAGGLTLPIGKHIFLVADKDAFGLLNVTARDGKKWALPIVAGTCTSADGTKTAFVLSEKSGAKTLVVPDNMFIEMQAGSAYTIEVALRNGNKRVISVVPAEEGAEIAEPAKEEAEAIEY